MLPPAPDLFSTTEGVASFACRCCCRMRASKSADPPAANGTMMVTGRCGHASCACAGAVGAQIRATSRGSAKVRRTPILQRFVEVKRVSHRFQMRVAPFVEILVGVAHGLGLAAPEHDLEIDRF